MRMWPIEWQKTPLFLPVSGLDLGSLTQMSETAVTRGAGASDLPNFQYCKALAMYRSGHFSELWIGQSGP